MRELIITTDPGLEQLLLRELNRLGYEGHTLSGRVYVHGGPNDVVKINYFSALAKRVFIKLSEFEFSTLDDIYLYMLEIPREERLEPDYPFAIRASRYPKEYPHGFRSVDVGKPAGKAVIDRIISKTGKRIPVNLKDPKYEIHVEIVKNTAKVMINTTGPSLHKRGYRVRGHPASLSTTIARFMTRLAGSLNSICDPLCGSGTILIEAWLEHQGVPIGRIRRKTYGRLWGYLKPIGDVNVTDYNERNNQFLYFGDRSPKHLDSALINSINASRLADAIQGYRIQDLATYRLADVIKTEQLPCDTIITNPPYGIRLGSPKAVEPTYEALFRLAKGKSLVLITPRHDLVERYASPPDEYWSVMHGDLKVGVYVWRNV